MAKWGIDRYIKHLQKKGIGQTAARTILRDKGYSIGNKTLGNKWHKIEGTEARKDTLKYIPNKFKTEEQKKQVEKNKILSKLKDSVKKYQRKEYNVKALVYFGNKEGKTRAYDKRILYFGYTKLPESEQQIIEDITYRLIAEYENAMENYTNEHNFYYPCKVIIKQVYKRNIKL